MIYLPTNTPTTHRKPTQQDAEAAKAAGAAVVGADDLVKAIQAGELNFDRCVATPEVMPLVSRVARVGWLILVYRFVCVCLAGLVLVRSTDVTSTYDNTKQHRCWAPAG